MPPGQLDGCHWQITTNRQALYLGTTVVGLIVVRSVIPWFVRQNGTTYFKLDMSELVHRWLVASTM